MQTEAPRHVERTSTRGSSVSQRSLRTAARHSSKPACVRVGTHPGASDVLSALALPSGKRLVAAPGNASGRLFTIVTNLTRDTYFWSVQAIDNSYAGGPFAQEKSVAVTLPGNLTPTVTADPVLYVGGEDRAALSVAAGGGDRVIASDLKLTNTRIALRLGEVTNTNDRK